MKLFVVVAYIVFQLIELSISPKSMIVTLYVKHYSKEYCIWGSFADPKLISRRPKSFSAARNVIVIIFLILNDSCFMHPVHFTSNRITLDNIAS